MTNNQPAVIKIRFRPTLWRENYKIEAEIRSHISGIIDHHKSKDKIIDILFRRPELIAEIETCDDELQYVLSFPQNLTKIWVR